MKSKFLLLLSFFFVQQISAQKISISGYVKDSANGETLIGATVLIKELKTGASTNQYGFYAINVDAGTYTVVTSYIGYTSKEQTISLTQNTKLNFALAEFKNEMREVLITGDRTDKNVTSTEMSRIEITGQKVKDLPVIFGEPDVLKAITLLPGIKSGGEASSGFYVRGGGPDQNLVLMDEGLIYNPSHLLGFLSVFNTDAVRNVEVIKGGMPAQYGGRLSSILNVTMKEGNNQKYQVNGGVGLIASRLQVEGPIKKDKSSFMISGRRTYIDALVNPFLDEELKGNGYYFYDMNAKANYHFSDKDKLFLSGYFGRDVFSFTSPNNKGVNMSMKWGNAMASLRWNHVFNNKIFSNLTASYNQYELNNEFNFEQNAFKIVFNASSGLYDWNLKYDFQHLVGSKHKLRYGAQYIFHTFQPGIASGEFDTTKVYEKIANQYAHEAAVYLQDEWKITSRLTVNAGLRYVAFNMIGPYTQYAYNEEDLRTGIAQEWKANESIALYHGAEPRIAATYLLNSEQSIKASFTQAHQFLHLATTSGAAFPVDLWMPSSSKVKPQKSYQGAIGYFRNFKNNEYETSVEAYYKPMYNQIEFKPGTRLFFNQNLENAVIPGTGLSYGIEFFVKKKFGKTSGWFGYTWSRTTRQFDELNNGETFFYRYDRTHDFSFVLTRELNRKWTANFVYVFGTGNAVTLPSSRMPFRIGIKPDGTPDYVFIDLYDKINDYRLPAYHRADISFTYLHKKTDKWESSWNFSIYNLYNRANPFFIYFYPNIEKQEVKAYIVYLFPIVPSVAWSFKIL